MEVILLKKIDRLGDIGDVVTVKNGYGRNFLVPNEHALVATESNVKVFEAKKEEIKKQNDVAKEKAQAISDVISKKFYVMIMQSGDDGKLFGAVTSRNVASSINNESDLPEKISHKSIRISESIKYTGIYTIKLILHADVIVDVFINVARSQEEAEEAQHHYENPPKEKKQSHEYSDLPIEQPEDIAEEATTEEEAAAS